MRSGAVFTAGNGQPMRYCELTPERNGGLAGSVAHRSNSASTATAGTIVSP
jgi:hypothetical protein